MTPNVTWPRVLEARIVGGFDTGPLSTGRSADCSVSFDRAVRWDGDAMVAAESLDCFLVHQFSVGRAVLVAAPVLASELVAALRRSPWPRSILRGTYVTIEVQNVAKAEARFLMSLSFAELDLPS